MKCALSAVWPNNDFQNRFDVTLAPGHDPEPDGWGVVATLIGIDKDSMIAKMRADFAIAIAEGNQGLCDGLNDVSATLEDGFVEIENVYLDEFIVHMDPTEFLRMLDWRISIIESDDYTNPDGKFESIVLEYETIPFE